MLDLSEASIKKSLITFAIPIIFSFVIQQLYLVVDTILVGKFLGVDELAAVGNAASIIGVFLIISGGLEMGCEVLIARFIGEKQYQTIFRSSLGILLFASVTAIILSSILILLQKPFFYLINIPTDLHGLTSDYLTFYSIGFIFIFLYDISRAILIAMGDTKIPSLVVLFTSILNVFLTLFFILELQMGVKGVAIATILAQLFGMLVTVMILRKRLKALPFAKEKFIFPKSEVFKLLTISYPLMIQQGVITGSMLILQALINPFGSQIISGYIAANKLIMLLMMITVGFCQTLTVFASVNIGAKKPERIQEAYRFCMKFVSFYVLAIVALDFFLAKPMVSIFIDEKQYPAAIAFGVTFLKYSCVMMLFYGWKNINESLLRGYAKMKSFLISNMSDLILRVAMAALLLPIFDLNSFWIANTIGTLIAFIVSMYFLKRHHILHVVNEKNNRFEEKI